MNKNQPFHKSSTSLKTARVTAFALLTALIASTTLALAHGTPPSAARSAVRFDPCQTFRPAGMWFPPQVEAQFAAQFAAQCGAAARSGGHAVASVKSRPYTYCGRAIMAQSWVPQQVERELRANCGLR